MKRTFSALLMVAISVLYTSSAKANDVGRVVECNSCPSTVNAAISKGNGLTAVVDFDNATLTAYEVEYDRERRRWRATRVPVPGPITAAFLRVMDATTRSAPAGSQQPNRATPAKAPGNSPTQQKADKGKGGLVVTVDPDNPQASNPLGFRFPDAYKNLNAGDIVISATARTQFGQHLAKGLAAADTTSAAWNSIALTVQELVLSWASKFGGGSIIVIVKWRDGSRTLYKVTTDNVAEAKYVDGESRDSNGNRIPDASITVPATAPTYVGNYAFGRGGAGTRNINQWRQSAGLYGVRVTGENSSRNQIQCSWDGRNLICRAM